MGNIFGGLGGLLGQGQAQQFGQQQQSLLRAQGSGAAGPLIYGNCFTSDSTATFTIDAPYGIGLGKTYGGGGQPEIKKPETAVAWLDRRVEEMRVRL